MPCLSLTPSLAQWERGFRAGPFQQSIKPPEWIAHVLQADLTGRAVAEQGRDPIEQLPQISPDEPKNVVRIDPRAQKDGRMHGVAMKDGTQLAI